MTSSNSDRNIADRVLGRAAIPLNEDLYIGVRIWRIRFLKRGLFRARLYTVLIYLSLRSMSDVFGSRSAAIKACAMEQDAVRESWKREYLVQLENLSPGYFFEGQSPLTYIAMWALKTTKISSSVLYLANRLDAIYQMFHSDDTTYLKSEKDEADFSHLMRLNREQSIAIDMPTAETAAARAAQLAGAAKTYRSFAVWNGEPKCEWRCSFVVPDRYHVTQAGAGDFDEWLTVGADHYWNFGGDLWTGPMIAETDPRGASSAVSRRERLNAFLAMDKVCTILSRFPITAAITHEHEGTRYAVLSYSVSPASRVPEIKAWLGDEFDSRDIEADIWISLTSGFPVKATLKAAKLDWYQVYIAFNEVVEIDAPNAAMQPVGTEPHATDPPPNFG